MQEPLTREQVRARMDAIPDVLSDELIERMSDDRARGWKNPYRTSDEDALRREERPADRSNIWRPAFVRDVEKILHMPAYNRYAGKTQVFSFRSNDDLSRRGLHVQLVARIARDIGYALGLNCDLIEAIGLGHDLGHTPFGHAGERCLNDVFHERTGRWFFHNVHSVRVLDKLYGRNISLQTLDGALCHNGEYEQRVFELSGLSSFGEFDRVVDECVSGGGAVIGHLRPMTLEGCVVRISDIIAYVGRDRQDAIEAGLLTGDAFEDGLGGAYNSWILTHASADIIEHSYGKDRIEMSEELFAEIRRAKAENYAKIYRSSGIEGERAEVLARAFELMYERCLDDLNKRDESSFICRHHITRIEEQLAHYGRTYDWQSDPEQTVVDYIASMTDGYFAELASKFFPQIHFPKRTYINEPVGQHASEA
ncbi:deoxyguanosinetriphosphate triphosphohydrolase family protein [Enorma shizhengliae]|uniref:HD domain-containing protein n=1 Tax=Enorma shizhengliae TaxID=2606615 RepID=A0A7K0GAD6_9ACTN|nr:HD domain-containing protein [Enorma shizhengliae]MRX80169.1 HD domain-containing protein [Enorma shizhengliae]